MNNSPITSPSDQMKLKQRKVLHNLVCDGRWTIFFGLWFMFNSIHYMFFENQTPLSIWEWIALFLILILVFLLSAGMGRAAIRVGIGGKLKKRYLLLGFLLLLLSIWSISTSIHSILTDDYTLLTITDLLTDSICFVMLFCISINMIRVRRFQHKMDVIE